VFIFLSFKEIAMTKKELMRLYVDAQLSLLDQDSMVEYAARYFLSGLRGRKKSEIVKMYLEFWIEKMMEDEEEYSCYIGYLEDEASSGIEIEARRLSKKQLADQIHYFKVEVPKIRDAMEEADFLEENSMLDILEENIMLSVMEEDSPE
jgi:hypothetical protein